MPKWGSSRRREGDVAVFNDKVTLIDEVKFVGGLTVSNSATVKIGAKMSGTGDLVKTGAGTHTFAAMTYSSFNGGVQVKEGQFTVLMA